MYIYGDGLHFVCSYIGVYTIVMYVYVSNIHHRRAIYNINHVIYIAKWVDKRLSGSVVRKPHMHYMQGGESCTCTICKAIKSGLVIRTYTEKMRAAPVPRL